MTSFRALWPLKNRHLQTVAGAFSRPRRRPGSVTRRVDLPDGDALAVEVTTPEGWTPRDPTAALVHGLTGSHESAYMVRLAKGLSERGWRAVRINFRGCGSGAGLARLPYHGGCSDDVRAVLELFARETPDSPLVLAGFSLGGNVVLKLAAELGDEGPDILEQVVTFCPAADLAACYRRLASRPLSRLYERFFVANMCDAIRRRNAAFPDDPHAVPQARTLREFDDLYTAPHWGFDGVDDYYARASARPVIDRIRVRTRVALAQNDPIVDPGVLAGIDVPSCVEVHHVSGGGHMGFVAAGGEQWLDSQLYRWLDAE